LFLSTSTVRYKQPMESAFAACEATVRRADPDRYFSALFAPADKRPSLYALYAFNHEIARIGELVREPMMGEIRLQWWREGLESARAQKPREHDVLRALSQTFARTDLPSELFESILDARGFDFSAETFVADAARDAYLDLTSGNLMRLAARILGAGDGLDALAHESGLAYGLAGLLRSRPLHAARNKLFIRDDQSAARDAHAHFDRARQLVKPGGALAAFLPAALVPLYLRDTAKDVSLHRKLLTFLFASWRGGI